MQSATVAASRWNHNIHYHRLVLAAVPPGSRTALDVGCGEPRNRWPHDIPYEMAGVVAHRWHRWRNGGLREMSAPTVWPPPDTLARVRATAERLLPGVRLRRHVLFRYSLLWTKPGRG
jgi:hypothetical protein